MKGHAARVAGVVCLILLVMLFAASFVALIVTAFGQGVVAGLVVLAMSVVAVCGTIALLTL